MARVFVWVSLDTPPKRAKPLVDWSLVKQLFEWGKFIRSFFIDKF
jgi:hypothetical protein